MGERQWLPMVEDLLALFPSLVQAHYQVTSPEDKKYNCVAWAARDTENWWWPGPDVELEYWPENVRREETLDAFREAFASLGYVACDTDDLEAGFEKVAIFVDEHVVPQHVSRQLPSGRWTSKIGNLEDIEHELVDLSGIEYGSVASIMKRPK